MKAIIYVRDFLVVVGVISLISLSADAYKFLAPRTIEPQKELFDWSVVGEYPNGNGTVVAVLEHGVSNTGAKTVPFYRVELHTSSEPDKWLNHWHVWNSQVREAPAIKWLGNNTLEIKHRSSTVYEYDPAVQLNNQTYSVLLNVLPTKP